MIERNSRAQGESEAARKPLGQITRNTERHAAPKDELEFKLWYPKYQEWMTLSQYQYVRRTR